MRTAGGNHDLSTHAAGIGAGAAQAHREKVVTGAVQVTGAIAIHRRRRVEIVHYQVERAVVIEIDVGGAIGESRGVESPGGGQVGEGQVAVVVERVIRLRHVRHLRNESR